MASQPEMITMYLASRPAHSKKAAEAAPLPETYNRDHSWRQAATPYADFRKSATLCATF
jgi:hypothetical protein